MRHLPLLVLAVLGPAGPAQEIDWHPDLATAEARAEKQGKPLLILFRCEP